jgi:drug/metabolite transporter (DMT)-like permease
MTRRGWLLFATLSLVWGIPYLLIKVAVEDLSPSVLVFGRCATAAAVLLPIAAARHELRPAVRAWRWVAVLAVVEIIGPFGLLAVAETRLTSSTTGVLIATVPLMAALATWRLGLEARPGLRRAAGLLIGFVGVVVLVGADLRGGDLLAALAVLAAAVGYTVGPLVIATRLRGVPPLGVITGAMLVSALAYGVPAARTWPDDAANVSGTAWSSVLLLGVVCSALAFVVMFALIGEAGPARMSVITYVNPAVALLLGVAVLDEPVTAGLAAGFGLILLGSWWGTSSDRPQAAGRTNDEGQTSGLAHPADPALALSNDHRP